MICSRLHSQSLSTANWLDGVPALVTFRNGRFSFPIRPGVDLRCDLHSLPEWTSPNRPLYVRVPAVAVSSAICKQ